MVAELHHGAAVSIGQRSQTDPAPLDCARRNLPRRAGGGGGSPWVGDSRLLGDDVGRVGVSSRQFTIGMGGGRHGSLLFLGRSDLQ